MTLTQLRQDMNQINEQLQNLAKIDEKEELAEIEKTTITRTEAIKTEEKIMETPPTKNKEKREYKPKNKSSAKKAKGTFEFPDGGWECSKCQNYNFKGRKECNRCKKVRTVKDLSGKPAHLQKLNQEQKKDKVPDLTPIENQVVVKEKP